MTSYRFIIFYTILLLFANNVNGQALPELHPTMEGVFIYCEEMPIYPGGNENMVSYIKSNLNYPEKAVDNGVQGKVLMGFVINEEGEIKNVEVLKSVSKEIDEEAIRLIKGMPKFQPGKQNGKPVKVRMTLPLVFKLMNE